MMLYKYGVIVIRYRDERFNAYPGYIDKQDGKLNRKLIVSGVSDDRVGRELIKGDTTSNRGSVLGIRFSVWFSVLSGQHFVIIVSM